MKPAAFAYCDPETLDEALALLAEHGSDAKILAGGQTLGPLLNMRMAGPQIIVDINRIGELDYRHYGEDRSLAIGALTRQGALEDDSRLRACQPLVADAIPNIAHRAIRNRGTVAGSLSHADPAAEWGGLIMALDAQLVIRNADSGTRTLDAADFLQGALFTALEPEDMLVEIRLPPWPTDSGWSFMEFARRHGDFALAGVLASASLDGQGCCRNPRIALIGVEDVAVRARGAEQLLDGQTVDAERLAAAARQAAADVTPNADLHASAAYRRHLTAELTRRALTQTFERASR